MKRWYLSDDRMANTTAKRFRYMTSDGQIVVLHGQSSMPSFAEQDLAEQLEQLADAATEAARELRGEAGKPETEPVCWHCLDVLLPDTSRPRCERCPDECDVEGCEEPGCAGESDAD